MLSFDRLRRFDWLTFLAAFAEIEMWLSTAGIKAKSTQFWIMQRTFFPDKHEYNFWSFFHFT